MAAASTPTNIVIPAVSVITNISFEHQRILGNTHAKIAREKAGVLKSSVPCIVGARGPSARRVISARAREVGAPLRWIDRDFESHWAGKDGQRAVGRARQYDRLRLGLCGPLSGRQRRLRTGGGERAPTGGLRGYGRQPSGLAFDAPNGPGASSGVEAALPFSSTPLTTRQGARRSRAISIDLELRAKTVLLFGAMRDKDHRRMLAAFDGRVDKRVYAAAAVGRSEPPERFSRRFEVGPSARSVRDAVARAKKAAGPDGLVVVAGSIFLVSEARALVKNARSDPPIALVGARGSAPCYESVDECVLTGLSA